jgi:hypothetical protein
MTLSPEQQAAVASWVAGGDSLSLLQRKLREQFAVSLTYMDLRFLIDDLNLRIVDAAPRKETPDLAKPAPAPAPARPAASPADPSPSEPGADAADPDFDEDAPVDEELPEDLPPGAPSVTVDVDKVTLHPGALASGSVTFGDGVTGKWIVDNYGRPGFTEISKPGYRPSAADAQAFMQELSLQLHKRGF